MTSVASARRRLPAPPADESAPSAWRYLPLPVLRGPLRGTLWLAASGGKLPRILLSTYEPEQTAWFLRLVRPGDVVLDVGAAAGYYTLLASRLVGPSGEVLAFEPDPRNAFFLRQHMRCNRRKNVRVHAVAVANHNGQARFAGGTGSGTGHLDREGGLPVPVVRLDDACNGSVRPTHMKIDVEGAELDVLLGARELLATCRPTLFLSTHNSRAHADCCRLLSDLGYRLRPMLGDDLATTTELLCQAQ